MCGHGRSCFFSCYCPSCSFRFLRWKQVARPALTMAIEYSVRLRYNSEPQPGCLHCWHSGSRQDSFITCLIEASIECRILKCARQHLACLATSLNVREPRMFRRALWFWCLRFCLLVRFKRRSELRRRGHRLQRRSTRHGLFTDLNG